MKVGLIPPRGFENFAQRSRFHLALAIPELMKRPTYAGMYTRAAGLGDFVVLDNGLAEGQPATPAQLIKFAKQIRASEIVLPDVMRAARATIDAVRAFCTVDAPAGYSFMAVTQGTEPHDFHKCVEEFSSIPDVTTVGLPRHMLDTLRSRACRIDLANWIVENFPHRFEIHLLGTNPVWLTEVRHAAKYAPHIRSVDTSMAFTYAIANEDLATSSAQLTRVEHYFDHDWSSRISSSLLTSNINTLLEWADATGTRSQASFSKLRSVSTP